MQIMVKLVWTILRLFFLSSTVDQNAHFPNNEADYEEKTKPW